MRNPKTLPALAFTLLAAVGCSDSGGGDDDGSDGDELSPIVFAHGCPPPPFGTAEDAGLITGDTQQMPGMADYFTDNGYPDDHLNSFMFSGVTCPPNNDYADELADYVAGVIEATGRPRVDIIGFSMGAVATRIYIREGGADSVEDFVSLAGASHGSILAGMVGEAGQADLGFPAYEGALEASPEYACEGESTEANVQFFLNGCLTEEGRTVEEDETPEDIDEGGHIRYLSVWNSMDDLVIPPQASCLNQAFKNDCSDGVNVEFAIDGVTEVQPDSGVVSSHAEMLFRPDVWETVFEFVSAPRE